MFGLLAMIPGLANGILGWLNKKTDADLEKFKSGVDGDTKINVEEIKARVQLAQAAMAERSKDRDHWYTAWMVPFAFLFFMGHAAAVVMYSTFWCAKCAYPQPWTVAALPPPYDSMQTNIILAICGIAGVGVMARKVFTR